MIFNEQVTLRPFSFPNDYQEVRQLWEHAGSGIQLRISDEPSEILKKLSRDPDLFILAEMDGKIVGTVIGGYDGRRGLIYHLAVDHHVREQGVGGILMAEVERRLAEKGCVKSYLLVTKDNDHAMKFYEKRGWKRMDNVFVYGKDFS